MSKTINKYPDWVEKYRSKGKTIRKTKYGYGLYKCTSIYDPNKKYPVSKQEFLGMICIIILFIVMRNYHWWN